MNFKGNLPGNYLRDWNWYFIEKLGIFMRGEIAGRRIIEEQDMQLFWDGGGLCSWSSRDGGIKCLLFFWCFANSLRVLQMVWLSLLLVFNWSFNVFGTITKVKNYVIWLIFNSFKIKNIYLFIVFSKLFFPFEIYFKFY